MAQFPEHIYQFHLAGQAYKRTCRQAWLLCSAFLLCILLGITGGCLLLPTYTHEFTFYLKWQDALVACCWCIVLVSLGGCILVLRFLHALRRGYREAMLVLEDGNRLTGRDLSPKNFASIFWAVTTTFACFVVMLIGLAPAVLIGWTLHLSDPVLVVFATIAAFLLSLGGLALSLPFAVFFIIGLVGGISFCRKMGAPQTYLLSSQTILRIDGFALAIIHPDKPESLFDLQLLAPEDQHQLLTLLREHWSQAEHSWNPTLGNEIEDALRETKRQFISS
jgi:hypothetical protein